MKILHKGYNSQGYYIVVTDYADEHNPNIKPHTMFYSSKEAYDKFENECKKIFDNFWQDAMYSNYKK